MDDDVTGGGSSILQLLAGTFYLWRVNVACPEIERERGMSWILLQSGVWENVGLAKGVIGIDRRSSKGCNCTAPLPTPHIALSLDQSLSNPKWNAHTHILEGAREGESYFGWSFDSEAFRISSKERHHLQKLACSVSRYWMFKTKRNSSASTQIEHRRLRVPKDCNLNLYSSSMSSHFLPHTKNHDESMSTASAPRSTELHPNL